MDVAVTLTRKPSPRATPASAAAPTTVALAPPGSPLALVVAPSAPPAGAPAAPDGHRPELLPLDAGEQYRFGFDMGACIGCHSCEVACAEQNGLPDGTAWRRVGEVEVGDHPDTQRFHMSMSCNHCLDPACLEGCPTDAYEKLANGVVAHHADDCVGCGYCTWTCPYSVPAIQPDRRIATKCDMCQPRLAEGMAPACVGACPTHAITIEKVDVAAWRADHAAADGPGLPDGGLTVSTTRVAVPERLAAAAAAGADAVPAGDWRLEPEHPHWPLVWLTVASQLALGASAAVALGLTGAGGGAAADLTAGGGRAVAAVAAVAALAGAMLHLGRPVAAWKAMRNLRRSWLSREVALLSLYAALAAAAVLAPALSVPAAVAGVAGVYASARLYLLPGRPAWDSRLTIVRFLATAAALGPALVGRPGLVAAGLGLSVGATALNWARLARGRGRSWRGPLVLELARLRRFTVARLALAALAVVAGPAGAPVAAVLAATLASEVVGRWLFYVTVVPTDVPGSFWRGTPAVAR